MYFVPVSVWSSLNAIRLYMSDFVLGYFGACLESSNSHMKEATMNILFRQIHSNWKTHSFIYFPFFFWVMDLSVFSPFFHRL
jgi:hypothetical protein